MTHQEIKELAGNRAVSPWIMKLVNDAVEIEREACAKTCDEIEWRFKELLDKFLYELDAGGVNGAQQCAQKIRARGQA